MNSCFLNNWLMAIPFRVLARMRSLFIITLSYFNVTNLSFKFLWNVFVEVLESERTKLGGMNLYDRW